MDLVDKLGHEKLNIEEFQRLIEGQDQFQAEISRRAQEVALENFGNRIYVRGLIEISNYCKNNCYYCGIRRDNLKVRRYALTTSEILGAIAQGAQLGFKTFVLQGGENEMISDEAMVTLIKEVKRRYPRSALTLSLGEKPCEVYRKFKEAGADRYLLRHETANEDHYRQLHPQEMSLKNRMASLYELKNLGYEVGSGFMVGSPGQTSQSLGEDLYFLQSLDPHMVGIGPYVNHKDTPLKESVSGSVGQTIYLISILRLMFPKANIPATTSLQTLNPRGRDRAILAGANVFMPNLTPPVHREDYSLYNNKAAFHMEAGENLETLKRYISDIGYEVVMDRGDAKK